MIDFKNPKVVRVINYVVILLMLSLGALWWYQYKYKPLEEQLISLEMKYKQKNKELDAIKEMKRNLERLKQQVAQSELELEELKEIFPESEEIANLIFDITKMSRLNTVFISKFVPVGDQVKQYYVENKYSVSVSTTYHRLGDFFASLANLKLIVNVDKLVIKKNNGLKIEDEDDLTRLDETIESTFELTTYSSKKE